MLQVLSRVCFYQVHLLVVGVKDALRLAAWLTAGGGGGIVGGVDLGWVLTSAGESGIVSAFRAGLPANIKADALNTACVK